MFKVQGKFLVDIKEKKKTYPDSLKFTRLSSGEHRTHNEILIMKALFLKMSFDALLSILNIIL